MQIKRVIVVVKLHSTETWHYPKRIHEAGLKKVLSVLQKNDIAYHVQDRQDLRLYISKKFAADLLITVGGDGTVLTTSHFTEDIPILGFNSAPKASVGFFCSAHASNFEKVLKEILAEKRRPVLIPRLQVTVGRKKVPFLALNEALFANLLPGDTTRYVLKIGRFREIQKSSGVWVATGAGSTAAIYSAGGKKRPITCRKIQFLTREPFRYPKNQFRKIHGFLNPGQKFQIIPQTDKGMVFLDGHALKIPVSVGVPVTFQGGGKPLKIFL